MKITQMIKRENFYYINEETLNSYYRNSNEKKTSLYIYPRLNAIVLKKPSKQVERYIFREYDVRTSRFRRFFIRSYVFCCLRSHGFLATKRLVVNGDISPDVLIYPCNRKYRIFNFLDGTVDVLLKYGFSNEKLKMETAFRVKTDVPTFVPRIIDYWDNGYREEIIKGRPLIRILDDFETLRDAAYSMLMCYAKTKKIDRVFGEYTLSLEKKIDELLLYKANRQDIIDDIVKSLIDIGDENQIVTTCFSHGDLQAGNIWVEDETKKIYIIDWESWGIRSEWYDRVTLYHGLRNDSLSDFLGSDLPISEIAVVLLEDIIFRLEEINSLPDKNGIEQFYDYCNEIEQWLRDGKL